MTRRRGFLAAMIALPLGVRAVKAVGPEKPPFYLPPITARERNPEVMAVAAQSLPAGQLVTADDEGVVVAWGRKTRPPIGVAVEDCGTDCYGRTMVRVRLN